MISKRMKAICGIMNNSNTVADIGCDHGYVAIELIKSGKAQKAICSDVRKGPLSKAEQHIREASLDEYIECRLSDGLSEYKSGEMDAVIIAGMGGPLIQKIMLDNMEVVGSVEQFVLSPQSDIESFRSFLYKNNLYIDDEIMIEEDNKYYFIMHVVHGECVKELTTAELKYGPVLLRNKDVVLKDFLRYERNQLESLLKQLENDNVISRIDEVKEQLFHNQEALSLYEVF